MGTTDCSGRVTVHHQAVADPHCNLVRKYHPWISQVLGWQWVHEQETISLSSQQHNKHSKVPRCCDVQRPSFHYSLSELYFAHQWIWWLFIPWTYSNSGSKNKARLFMLFYISGTSNSGKSHCFSRMNTTDYSSNMHWAEQSCERGMGGEKM